MIYVNVCFLFEYESVILVRVWFLWDLGGVVFEYLVVVCGLWSVVYLF